MSGAPQLEIVDLALTPDEARMAATALSTRGLYLSELGVKHGRPSLLGLAARYATLAAKVGSRAAMRE